MTKQEGCAISQDAASVPPPTEQQRYPRQTAALLALALSPITTGRTEGSYLSGVPEEGTFRDTQVGQD